MESTARPTKAPNGLQDVSGCENPFSRRLSCNLLSEQDRAMALAAIHRNLRARPLPGCARGRVPPSLGMVGLAMWTAERVRCADLPVVFLLHDHAGARA
jgi:hypothetical protein